MGPIVFWNKTKYADILADFFGNSNIITEVKEFVKIVPQWEKFTSIIMLCELNWSSNDEVVKMQRLCGIEMVKELRRTHNIDLPVLFVSFLSRHKLFNAESEILTAIGHTFCQLPIMPEIFFDKLEPERKLTPIELKDIQLFSCNPKGIVNVKIHQIQGIISQINSQSEAFIKGQLEKCIEEIHSVFKVNGDVPLNKFRIEFHSIDNENINRALRFIDEIGNGLIDKYASSTLGSTETSFLPKPWKILLLDDELNVSSELVKLLKTRGVEVICTSNANDAMNVLFEDDSLRGKISLILSDYRLNNFEGEILVQQKKQGYTFLQEVGDKFYNRLLSAVVYSGMPRQFLLETFKAFKIRPEIYSKRDFKLDDVGARNFLVNRIIEIGDANYEALLMLPLASRGWAEHLHDIYLLYRRQSDYEKRERDICDFCVDWIDKFRTGQNPLTPMIKGDAFNPKKHESEVNTIERFEAYYKTRRLALFLSLYYDSRGLDPLDIIPPMLSPKGKKMDTPELKRGFFSQIIGLKREEFPFGATVEELCWFEYDLGIKVLDSYKRFRNKLNTCESLIGTFIEDITKLKMLLVKISYRYIDERKHELLFDSKSYNPYLFDKMDLGLCIEWLNLQKESFTEIAFEEYLSLINSINEIWK